MLFRSASAFEFAPARQAAIAPAPVQSSTWAQSAQAFVPGSAPDEKHALADIGQALRGLTLDEIERIAVEAAIDEANGSLPAAAKALGVSPSTLYRKRERWLGVKLAR